MIKLFTLTNFRVRMHNDVIIIILYLIFTLKWNSDFFNNLDIANFEPTYALVSTIMHWITSFSLRAISIYEELLSRQYTDLGPLAYFPRIIQKQLYSTDIIRWKKIVM